MGVGGHMIKFTISRSSVLLGICRQGLILPFTAQVVVILICQFDIMIVVDIPTVVVVLAVVSVRMKTAFEWIPHVFPPRVLSRAIMPRPDVMA